MRIKKIPLLIIPLFLIFSCRTGPGTSVEGQEDEDEFVFDFLPEGSNLPVSTFSEIWAYVVTGRESALKKNMPITDIGYFSADINSQGKLVDIPVRKNLPVFSGRVHLVVICDSYSLSNFILIPGSEVRKTLINDMVNAASNFDGLQIDFENIPKAAGNNFISFLTELRAALENKIFTIAVPARIKKIDNDVFDYARILPLVDRMLVMAYDEHWSGSSPGPVASMDWCYRVAKYSLAVIGKEKLIMGLPFYGRAWSDYNHSQAYVYSGIERIINEYNVTDIKRENGIPTFEYKSSVTVKVYYEDAYSLSARMEMYRTLGVTAIGFWRLGQETTSVWRLLQH